MRSRTSSSGQSAKKRLCDTPFSPFTGYFGRRPILGAIRKAKSMAASAPIVLTVRHAFASSRERVFDAWLNPAGMERWMFGPEVRDEEIVHLRVDARVGGHFSFLVR